MYTVFPCWVEGYKGERRRESKAGGALVLNHPAMSAPVPYFDVIRSMKYPFDYRLRRVVYARRHGIKAAVRAVSPPAGNKLRSPDASHGQTTNQVAGDPSTLTLTC